ncbi:flavodoxin domain-containing protein [Phaeacidiphilus oryzae]|jgi:menaquinone-dependent protoporphyrinogen oxidase|uniref:flavodoxin domain-containing protein n=1 Tax=Phaeacidiphilus oryzae TaxID=348818 RepID=UPI000568BD3A|nr:flavodoxin domain-containing protein [Phaeacidiphilus oryzae]
MSARTLIGYATESGSTRSIADRIGERLTGAGVPAELADLSAVKDSGRFEALDAFDAFVLGSAVHGQAWLPVAREFVAAHRALLGERPLWLFSVGMPGALRGPWRGLSEQESPRILAGLGPLGPHEHRLFSGVISPAQLPPFGRFLFRVMGFRYGDYRDWPAVEAWADGIARRLSAS